MSDAVKLINESGQSVTWPKLISQRPILQLVKVLMKLAQHVIIRWHRNQGGTIELRLLLHLAAALRSEHQYANQTRSGSLLLLLLQTSC